MTLFRAAMNELSDEPLQAFLLVITLGLLRREVDTTPACCNGCLS
jgi:hypothetical protein